MRTDAHRVSTQPSGKSSGDHYPSPAAERPGPLQLVPHPKVRRLNVLDVGISAINLPMARDYIDGWTRAGARRYVCITGVRGVIESQHDEAVRRVHNAAGLVTPDGMPLGWLLKLGGHSFADRVYGPDLMLALSAHGCKTGYRHFLYDFSAANLAKLRANLESHFPETPICRHTFRALAEKEDANVVGMINASEADIVWVGLSTPKQEKWMAEHCGRLKLFSERMCRHFLEDFGLETRIVRYHNVYGPNGTYDGGREKAPAAICHKVIEAKLAGNHCIEI
jgi:N-acetylglucosaminyldiphosphoundecaprenol N-acetyl-beta-D-mannosaminyltransferase